MTSRRRALRDPMLILLVLSWAAGARAGMITYTITADTTSVNGTTVCLICSLTPAACPAPTRRSSPASAAGRRCGAFYVGQCDERPDHAAGDTV